MEKLDLSGVRIYSNTKDDARDAIDLIGEEVYLSDWTDFRGYDKGNLLEVKYAPDVLYPFLGGHWHEARIYKYFILVKDAKFIEGKPKKLRPFTSTYEFTQETGCIIGDVITIRRIDGKFEESCIVNGFKLLDTGPSTPHRVYISLGSNEYSLEKLMCCFDYMKDGEWHPFGIEE